MDEVEDDTEEEIEVVRDQVEDDIDEEEIEIEIVEEDKHKNPGIFRDF